MKLYTEQQVKEAIILGRIHLFSNNTNEILERLTPIELPSDEEISIQASNRHYGTNFKHVYASGAKWMKEQILNQNK